MKFTNLHQHTTYSFLDGFGTPKQIIDRLTAIKQDSIAMTDHGNIYAHVPFTKVFKEAGKHLVYGCEFYIVERLYNERGYNHITILAKNNIGYANLLKLANVSYHQKYYKPRITFDQLVENSKGLIILSGCVVDGYLHTGNLEWWLSKFKKCEWYVELQPFIDEKEKWNKLTTLAKKKGLPCLITFDSHYPKPEDRQTHDFMLAINTNKPLSDPDRLKMDYPLHIPSIDEVIQRCKEMGKFKEEWITDTYKIAKKCNVELPKTSMVKVNADINKIKEKCYNELKKTGLSNNKVYIDRLNREIKLIKEKGFTDYFYVISDIMKYAKSKFLCGAGRGSSSGSLVCMLLGITEIDPIKHNLLFERFIDINRSDLPDIDLDFPASKRDEIINYIKDKYGNDNVAQLITFAIYRPRGILQDAARILKIPQWEIKKAADQIVERSSADYRADFCLLDSVEQFPEMKKLFEKYPKLYDVIGLEGQIKQVGKSAASLAISSKLINEISMINDKGGFGIEGSFAEKYGLLKIDVLGLETLDVIMDICNEVNFDWRKIYTLPLDDKKVYREVFQSNKLIGIFQFEGVSVSNICNQIKPVNFSQLTHITALGRPGAISSGGMIEYINRFNGKKYEIDEVIKSYVEETFGVVIFQEQVMFIVKNIGGFSWEDTSTIRKAMSKSMGMEFFNKFRDKFIKGAKKNGIPKDRAINIWNQIYTHGAWGFNASHACSYALLTYLTAYFKAYYPLQFYARILKDEIDEIKIKKILKEYDGKVIPLDINKSKIYFSTNNKDLLIGGFTNIKGIGAKAAIKIVNNQPYKSIEDFGNKNPTGIASKIIIALKNGIPWTNVTTFKNLIKDKIDSIKLPLPITDLNKLDYNGRNYMTVGKVTNVNLKDHNEDSKVQKRGYRIQGVSEYISLRVMDDDYNPHYIVFDKYFTDQNKQMLLNLKNKICLFKVYKLEGGLILGKSVKIF